MSQPPTTTTTALAESVPILSWILTFQKTLFTYCRPSGSNSWRNRGFQGWQEPQKDEFGCWRLQRRERKTICAQLCEKGEWLRWLKWRYYLASQKKLNLLVNRPKRLSLIVTWIRSISPLLDTLNSRNWLLNWLMERTRHRSRPVR